MKSESIRTAAAYIRVSTEDQTEYSPAAQLRELQEYAAAHSIFLDPRYVYSDEGISGRKAEKRPGFMRMISDAKRKDHPFDLILVHKFDRFARSREDSIVYKSMLRRAGVDVVSIKEPLSDGAYSGVMEAIYESFAEAYSINLGMESKKGMKERALRGEPNTAPPFGYRMENGRFYPHESEAPIVVQIFERFAAGDGLFPIARWATENGIRTHRGTPFENRTVEYILRNPVYIGMLRWNPAHRSRRDFTDPNILTVQGKHEPIVSRELWDRVQVRMAEVKARWRYHARPSYDRKHWLCGIVRCSACGATLVFNQPRYLKCANYAKGRCTHTQHVTVDTLATAVISRLRDDLSSSEAIDCRILHTTQTPKASSISNTVSRLQAKLDRLTDAYLDGAIPLEDYSRLRSTLSSELLSAQSQLSSAPLPDPTPALRSSIRCTLETLESDATVAQKYDALNSIIDRCTFDKDTNLLSLTYRVSL